jgi:hypothetical protein
VVEGQKAGHLRDHEWNAQALALALVAWLWGWEMRRPRRESRGWRVLTRYLSEQHYPASPIYATKIASDYTEVVAPSRSNARPVANPGTITASERLCEK